MKSVMKVVTILKMNQLVVHHTQEKSLKFNNPNKISNLRRNKISSKFSAASYAFAKKRIYGHGTMRRHT
jgi:hypothetical protein